MEKVGYGKRTSDNGYESQVTYYQAKRCEGYLINPRQTEE